MMHSPHDGPEGAILFDGCEECDARAADPIEALLRLDSYRFVEFTERVLRVEYDGQGSYLTKNEAKVGRLLYYISLLVQRNPTALDAIERTVRS